MEDSFQARVDKIFGSLTTTSIADNTSASNWSLTDEEVERQKWNRPSQLKQDDDDEEDFKPPVKSDLIIKDEDEEEEIDEEIDGKKRQRGRSGGVKAIGDEDFDVLSNIGRDCTLDFEEEEDEYDKVAVGAGNNGDHIYMREVKLTELDELPNSFPIVTKDPRADPLAAKTRLEEDVGTSDYLRNPSKYTRYTFDSSADMGDQSNNEAYMDIVRLQRKEVTESSSEGDMLNTPRSVIFTPRMKPEYESIVTKKEREHGPGDDMTNKAWSVAVTAEDSQEAEVSDMEEDEPCVAADNNGFQKPSRKYRARNNDNV